MNNKELIARAILNGISEELIASVYEKTIVQMVKDGTATSHKFNFYLSVFYEDNLLKSRTLNYKKEAFLKKEIEDIHFDFFMKNKSLNENNPVSRYTSKVGKFPISILRVGYFSVIVSDNSEANVHLCGAIIATMYVLNKAAALVKEWGHFHDLKTFFKKEDESIYYFLEKTEKVMKGELGGYKK
jgi:hypothetical protein